MKRLLCLLLSLVLCVTLYGCSFVSIENNFPENKDADISEVAPEVEPAEKIVDESGGWAYRMSDEETEEYIDVFIRPLYNSINESAEYYDRTENGGITVWKSGGTVMKKEIQGGTDGNDMSRQYYFDPESGELMFAFVFKGTEEHRLYFKSGKLIRYIDAEGNQANYPRMDQTSGLAELALSECY